MILVVSTLGAINRYPNQEMMEKTFRGFLESLNKQTNKSFRLFLACHDIPRGFDYNFIEWCSVQIDIDCKKTKFWAKPPEKVFSYGELVIGNYDSLITDMSRKTIYSTVLAGRWAYHNNLKEFWMLRMDSDDLLAKDSIEKIIEADQMGYEAVYTRRCHMFDVKTKKIAIHQYPYSLTCNAIKMRIDGDHIERWYYLCRDHTKFFSDVKRDNIKAKEIDNMLCITTNSGNSISGRGDVETEKYNTIVECTEELIERYGLWNL